MFIDTSVLVALLVDEPDARRFASRLAEAKVRYTSALVILEAAAQLSALLDVDPVTAGASVQALLDEADIFVVSLNASIAGSAVAAFAAYGAGRGHPARLTPAQCMSYACAKAYRVPLLFKGEGFAHTDIRAA